MEIDIVVIGNFEAINQIFKIEDLTSKLIQLGFSTKILHEFPSLTQNKYLLLFNNNNIQFSIEYSRCVVLMNTTLSSILKYIKIYDFAALIEVQKYIHDIPIICGKVDVSGKSNLVCNQKFSDKYGFIKDLESKGIVELLVNYLTEYGTHPQSVFP